MIRLTRPPLDAAAQAYVNRQAAKVAAKPAAERQAEANRLWNQKSDKQFGVVRSTLEAMCSGYVRCMYCEDSRATAIDHFEPKALNPRRAFDWLNYLLACSYCNSNEKRDQYPAANGTPLLVDPTAEDPADHVTFTPTTGEYAAVPGSPKADETLTVFGINTRRLPDARRDAWDLLQITVVEYDSRLTAGNIAGAGRVREIALKQPFAGVLRTLLHAAQGPDTGLVTPECRAAVAARPEIAGWL